MKFAEAVCPFCEKPFHLPQNSEEYLYYNHTSSCGCGAAFCLVDADDVGATMLETSKDYKKPVEFKTIENFDSAPFEGSEKYDEPITAVFWREV